MILKLRSCEWRFLNWLSNFHTVMSLLFRSLLLFTPTSHWPRFLWFAPDPPMDLHGWLKYLDTWLERIIFSRPLVLVTLFHVDLPLPRYRQNGQKWTMGVKRFPAHLSWSTLSFTLRSSEYGWEMPSSSQVRVCGNSLFHSPIPK